MSRNSGVNIVVNGDREVVSSPTTIADLIELFHEADTHLIVQHNGRCLYPQSYATTAVSEGDVVEFIHPAFGG
jgi:thiamine biosynthesis protein ThiS